MQRKLALLLVPLLAATLWGCGSNRDSDSSRSPVVGIEDAASVGNCTICHTIDVHTDENSLVGQNPDPSGLGSAITHDCEACHGGGQYHHGEGPIPFAAPDVNRCAACHAGVDNVPASAHATMNCNGCHEPLMAEQRVVVDPLGVEPDKAICSQCHNAAPTADNPFLAEIYSRFETSRHAAGHARTAFCSACHSHEGGVALLSMGRKTSIGDLVAAYNSTTVGDIYNIEEEAGLSTKTCATCHDPHAASLRGDGDVLDADGSVVFSAEFNLCTACHMVDLTPTLAGHADAGNLYSYELSDQYLKENLVDASTGTWKQVDIEGRGPTAVASVFYHDGTSANNRHIVDTHFGGTIYSSLVNIGAADTEFVDMPITGYNINAGNKNACTICHDPHTGGKILSPLEVENNDNSAISYAEGLGDFHTNYLGEALGHGCLPCHKGDSLVPLTLGATLEGNPSGTGPIGCRTCHNLALPNSTVGTNDAAAFAAVREFQPGYEFKFPGGTSGVEDDVVVDVADLGVNQICFECHKGRTGVKPDAGTTTQVYGVSYLHYAPSMAILFGDESKMVPTYAGKTYAGKFVHGGGAVNGVTEFGCVDCHDVHNTDGNNVVQNKMVTSADCAGCHQSGASADADVLKDQTVAYGQRLHDTIIAEYNTRFDPDLTADAFHAIISGRGAATEIGANDLAYAASIYKIFNYEDGSPTGTEHGHGGSWAHNSRFARQVQYDAIEALGGDLTGLTRP